MMAACAARFDPAVEAAFLATYGVDVLADPGPSPRRVVALLRGLPSGSLPQSNTGAAWTTEAHLLAAVVDAVNWLTWVQVAKASKRKPKEPKPIPRPGSVRPKRRMSFKDLAGALEGVEGVRS